MNLIQGVDAFAEIDLPGQNCLDGTIVQVLQREIDKTAKRSLG